MFSPLLPAIECEQTPVQIMTEWPDLSDCLTMLQNFFAERADRNHPMSIQSLEMALRHCLQDGVRFKDVGTPLGFF